MIETLAEKNGNGAATKARIVEISGDSVATPIRLNIGSGASEIPGYTNIDCKRGGEAYPLTLNGKRFEDCSVDAIYASHVLEHFSHRLTEAVLTEWVRVLKPGGLLQLAVPDVDKCFAARAAGKPWPFEQYLMGGQIDQQDFHGALFDEPTTRAMMRSVGLRHIRRWQSTLDDCAALPISLNLQGIKAREIDCKHTVAVMSVPRLTFVDNFRCATDVLGKLGIELFATGGAFWHKAMTQGIQKALDNGAKRILAIDYDSIFDQTAVEDLHYLMNESTADAICAAQCQRGKNRLLACVADEQGNYRPQTTRADYDGELTRLLSGHFGLTLLRADAFADLRKPWFFTIPDEQGEWGEKSHDADMQFWVSWREQGKSVYQANHVACGHAELMITWPDDGFHAMHQYPDEFHKSGPPANVRR